MKTASLSIIVALIALIFTAFIHSWLSVNTFYHSSTTSTPHSLPPIVSLHGIITSPLSDEDIFNLQEYIEKGVKITAMGDIDINGIVHYPLPNGATRGWLVNGAFWCEELPKP